MYNVRDMGWIPKRMSIHQMDSKGTIKSNFVTSYLVFRDSISIELTLELDLANSLIWQSCYVN